MSLLDLNLGDAVEPKAVDPDREYKIRISEVRSDEDKNGNPYLLPRFEIPDEPASKDFTKFLSVPRDGMTPKQLNTAKWRISEFLQAFGRDPSLPFSPEDLVGLEGWAILGREETEEYGEQNFVRKFIRPKE